jgi:putative heme-binding domain-containing protein
MTTLLMRAAGLAVVLAIGLSPTRTSAEDFELNEGDHIAIIGNTLAERMQHDGWLETLTQMRFPDKQLVFRNLGFSGDELTQRLRSSNFGSPDEWLRRCEADVVFACFGYNESYGDEAELGAFESNLRRFIESTLNQKYNGESAPRLVLLSPIAHERLNDPNLPDPSENNRRIALYTEAIKKIATEMNVGFVDLFTPTKAYQGEQPLTINGVHLTEHGNRVVAAEIVRQLFGEIPTTLEETRVALVRSAVQDKNFTWFNRYRTTDGFSIYGGRADLRFTAGQTNRDVMQREMEVLDVMTANRDKHVWAAVEGEVMKDDDSNAPPFLEVVSNKPGPLPGGKHVFLSGVDAISKMTVPEGFQIELFASEEDFPELINPVQMAFDPAGRLIVATWDSYPHWKPGEPMNDKLLILEDTNGDGKADSCKTFADGLHNPTGFEFYGRGVYVAMAPDLLYLEDTDGDGKADLRKRVLHGLDSADTHHTANSFVLGPGGDLYFQEGTFHHTQVETPYKPSTRSANGAVFRYEPTTQNFELYTAYGFANPHGHVFDDWGQDIVHDGTGAVPYHGAVFSGHLPFPTKHGRAPTVYQQRTRPCAATEMVGGSHFPPEMNGNLLVLNVIGFQGILQYEIKPKGSSIEGVETTPLLTSSDVNFRPVDLEFGPDGSLFVCDWQNPIIGHMQHNLRDPNRDREHGRVYRITHSTRPLDKVVPIAGRPVEELVALLAHPTYRVRYRAKMELAGRDAGEVVDAVGRWLPTLDESDKAYEHHLLEALWMNEYVNHAAPQLLERVLNSPDHRARAAAVRVACHWRHQLTDTLGILKRMAADEHPLVRLEAVRSASYLMIPEAMEVPLVAATKPMDQYLDYVHAETLKALEPLWKNAIQNGDPLAITTDAGERYLLRTQSVEQLLKRELTRGVCRELLLRPSVPDRDRQAALTKLASLEKQDEIAVLLSMLAEVDGQPGNDGTIVDFARLLSTRNRSDLGAIRPKLERLTREAKNPLTRQIGFVALISADGNVDRVWDSASKSTESLHDLVAALPLVPDPGLKAALYPKVLPLLDGLPEALAPERETKGTYGRYVRIELPGQQRTLTLAEVEVHSDGQNIARRGKASQSGVGFGGSASRGIDGNTSASYGGGGQTHTPENMANPWWEVDLGGEYAIDSITVFNRMEGFSNRLEGFTLQVLDPARTVVFEQKDIPAPEPKAEFEVGGGGPTGLVRRAAMEALVSVRGHEDEVFTRISQFVIDGEDRSTAVRALQRIAPRFWPEARLEPLAEALVKHVETIPEADRNTPAALDVLQLADAVASRLPAEIGRSYRSRLGELSVRVIRIATVPHRMAYDREQFAVQAGKPLQIIFENPDIMPHNFVIVQPGKLQPIGELAEATAQDPAVQARGYAPKSPDVLLASELLQGQQQQVINFTAPKKPGVYPYVCTYPGHWRRMYGALYVVDDLESYTADPVAYLATHDLPIQDELLALNRPRTEWKIADLEGELAHLGQDRSFARGKHLFEVANCAACHKMHGAGYEIGPELSTLDAKIQPREILESLIEPSLKIADKYRSHTFLMNDGRIVTGMIVTSNDDAVRVIENPLAAKEPVSLARKDIEEQVPIAVSIMPKGLLEKLTRDEILDLLTYLVARGKENSPLYGEGHAHGAHQH